MVWSFVSTAGNLVQELDTEVRLFGLPAHHLRSAKTLGQRMEDHSGSAPSCADCDI